MIKMVKPSLPSTNKHLIHCSTAHVANNINSILRTESWKSMDRLKTTSSSLAYIICSPPSIQIHSTKSLMESNIQHAQCKVIEIRDIQQCILPFRSTTDIKTGNEIAIRSSEMVIISSSDNNNDSNPTVITWVIFQNNQTRGDLLEKISQYNTKFAVEQRSLMETIAGVVNLKTHTQQADARRKKSKTKQRSAPLRLHWVQDNTHGVANNSSISSPSSVTSTSTSKFIVAGCQIAIVNGVYQQKGIAINTKRNRLDLSLSVSMENFLESSSNTESSPWFWKEESNVYLVREIAQDGSVGWVIGTEKDGVLVAAQSLSMSSPPLNNWVRVVKNGCIRSQMELVLLEGGLV